MSESFKFHYKVVLSLFLDSVEEGDGPRRRVRPPKIKVTPHERDKRLENCSRTVPQFLMRGEHIVFINVVNEEGASSTKG